MLVFLDETGTDQYRNYHTSSLFPNQIVRVGYITVAFIISLDTIYICFTYAYAANYTLLAIAANDLSINS